MASYPHEAGELSGLLRRADQRLHMAKLHGRNRVLARDA
jgi:PleD family two-component response regulator